jgi:hypothetical protein
MTSHQRPLSIVYGILSLTNSTLLAVGMLCTKEPVPDDHPPSKEKFIFICQFCDTHESSCTPTKTDLHFYIPLGTAMSDHLTSVFLSLGSLSKKSIQVQSFVTFHIKIIFNVRSREPNTQPPSWRTTPCRLSAQLLIQRIRRHLPQLEAFFSICNLRLCYTMVTRDPLNPL